MRFLELFAGIGGFRRAGLNAGWIPIGWAEIDKFARQSFLAIWPESEQEWMIGDVSKVSDEELEQKEADVIMAGFPCQSFSVAGKRGGFEDTRGTLFFEVARYAKHIQPKWIIAENVKGLLNHDSGKTIRVILETLNEIGYEVDFHVYNATEFNVPQNRERIFIIAKRKDIAIKSKPSEVPRPAYECRLINDMAGNLFDPGVDFLDFPWPAGEGLKRTLADVLETEVDEKYFLSEQMEAKIRLAIKKDEPNNPETEPCCEVQPKLQVGGMGGHTGLYQVEQQAELKELTDGMADAFRVYDANGVARTLKAEGGGAGAKTGLYQVEQQASIHELTKSSTQTDRVYAPDGIAPTLRHGSKESGNISPMVQIGVVRQGYGDDATYSEREVALTIDANYHKGLDAHQARTGVAVMQSSYRGGEGEGWEQSESDVAPTLRAQWGHQVPHVRAVIDPMRDKTQNGRRIKDDGEPMFTLTAQDRHGVMIQRSQSGTREKEISGTIRAGASTTDMTVMIAQRRRGFNDGGLHEIAPTVSTNAYEQNNHVVSVYDAYNGKK